MPPVVAFVGGVVSGAVSAVGGLIQGIGGAISSGIGNVVADFSIKKFIGNTVISAVIGTLLRPDPPSVQQAQFAKNMKVNNTSNVQPIPVIYGKRRVGGSEFRATVGDKNEYIYRILVLCEGQIDSVEKIFLNDDESTRDKYNGLITTELKNGTINQTASSLLLNGALSGTNNSTKLSSWTSNHKAQSVAYLVVRLKFDADVFSNGLPLLNALVKGKKVYDPRLDSTVANGNGLHRFGQENESTHAWSENPALCILDFLTNNIYGRGIPISQIDIQSFITEANYCDDLQNFNDSSGNTFTAKRYTCNGLVNTEQPSIRSLRELLLSCRGKLVLSDKYKLIIDKPTTAVFTFDKNNMVGEWNIFGLGVKDFKNKINARFADINNNYDQTIHVVSSSTFLEADNNRILDASVFYPFVVEHSRADVLTQHTLKESRLKWGITFTATLEAISVEAMDLVYVKHPSVGWSSGSLSNGKLFRVTSVELSNGDTVKIQAREYDASVYTSNINTPPSSPTTALVDPNSTQPPTNLSLSSANQFLINNDGTIIERIQANWQEPQLGYVRFYEIAYKALEDTNFTIVATNDTSFFIAPCNSPSEGTGSNQVSGIYKVKVRAVYGNDKRSEYTSEITHTVQGKTTIPNPVNNFTFQQTANYGRQFFFEPPNDRDIKGFVIRGSTNLNAQWDDMLIIHTGHMTVSPYETFSIAKGTYKFSIRVLDTSNNLSDEFIIPSAVVEDDPNIDIVASFFPRLLEGSWTGQGFTGTQPNTKRAKQLTFVPTSGTNIVLNFSQLELEESFSSNSHNPAPSRFSLYESDITTLNSVQGKYYLYRESTDNGTTKTWSWNLAFFRTGRPFNGNKNYESLIGSREVGTFTESDGEPITYPYAMTGRYYINSTLKGDMLIDTTGNNAFYNLSLSSQGSGIFHLTKTGETYLMENEDDVWDLQLSTTFTGNWKTIDSGRGNPVTGHYVFDSSNYGSPSSAFLRVLIYRDGEDTVEIPVTQGGIVDSAGDLSCIAGENSEWRDLGSTTWANWTQWGFGTETMTYTTNGFEFATPLSFTPIIQASGVGTISHEVSYVPTNNSKTSNFSSGDYTNFTSAYSTQITAKAIRTRTTVTGVNATLKSLGILLDGKQKTETIANLNTANVSTSNDASSTAGHIYLPLTTEFSSISTIQISFNGEGSGRTFAIIDKTSVVIVGGISKIQPEIKLYDNNGNNIDAIIDVSVTGF